MPGLLLTFLPAEKEMPSPNGVGTFLALAPPVQEEKPPTHLDLLAVETSMQHRNFLFETKKKRSTSLVSLVFPFCCSNTSQKKTKAKFKRAWFKHLFTKRQKQATEHPFWHFDPKKNKTKRKISKKLYQKKKCGTTFCPDSKQSFSDQIEGKKNKKK